MTSYLVLVALLCLYVAVLVVVTLGDKLSLYSITLLGCGTQRVLVTSSSMRLSPILWWLATQAPQVHLVHMVRNPRGVLAEMMATARLRGTPLAEEEVRIQLADLCQDLRDDLAAAGNLHHSRYTRIK